MNTIERQIAVQVDEISGRMPKLDDDLMQLLDSLGMQRLLAQWDLEAAESPALADLQTVRALAVFLANRGVGPRTPTSFGTLSQSRFARGVWRCFDRVWQRLRRTTTLPRA